MLLRCFLLEKLITPESFAEVLCDDLDLPTMSFLPQIVQSMQQQIKQHSSQPEIPITDMADQRVVIKVRKMNIRQYFMGKKSIREKLSCEKKCKVFFLKFFFCE